MSSIQDRVLALKYRPKRFEDLIGQSTVSQTLSLALDSSRLSHAYLFSGLRGSGKTSTARIMAKALLCEKGPTSKPCEVCENCASANSGKHLDIIEMDAASNRGIDDIKELIEHTKYKPSLARFKVFIIDEVHMLTTQAFNALLKTLEEPPGFVKFILATTDALKLPATILSRTQHFRFNKISQNDVVHHLSHILHEEKIDFEKDALNILARGGQGSLRDTLTLLDQAIIFSKNRVDCKSVVEMLGLINPEKMEAIFSIILNQGDINDILKELEIYETTQVIDEMTLFLKDKMISKDRRFDIILFDRFFRILSDAKHLLAINSDGTFVLILTFMKLMEATKLKSIDDIINKIEKIEPKPETTKVAKVTENILEEPISVKEPIETLIKVESISKEINVNIEVEDKMISNTTSLNIIADAIPALEFQTPFDELPTIKPEEDFSKEEISAVEIEKIEEISYNPVEEIEYVPFVEERDESIDLYTKLTEKVYDRDFELGECFEKNFIYNGFSNNVLQIISYAKDEERKLLYKHFGIIKAFAQEVFGSNVELDFKKEEATILNESLVKEEDENRVQEEQKDVQNDIGSMIEDIEVGSGCVASILQATNETLSSKELLVNDILNSKMVDKVKELFDIRKITVKSRS
ncbi:DNA polymerase III subunit gamma/tau [Aliarcobacter cibarius]|jgi:DNA polymerase III subunit gamma/tau|uniref:DNA polymerase III subunit gamma/tau n=1 Tax=Aliarcobacter cibarius TaxID=255507 RepID=A0ABY2VBN1_9BACT|nr:DNA polymerase III subunit gamma/tau [Aliarcobacter cibarius]QEZ89810.1 DNA polymerase III, gamma and tau subunits [Aliarcobacter cibarius]TLT01032.1 DNA polymerase III subunit gamma/tau [Aliarcobacter cibarius]TLT01129.1 DNA polymerase III subunit gamma/tau [Aliarcobacter cibarius]